jgi:hypothetical protein
MKKIIPIIIVAIVAGGLSFYGGMKYGQSANPQTGSTRTDFQQMRSAGVGQAGQRSGFGQGQNGGFTGGEIISKDDKSITVKLRDGSSKIVFVSASTEVMKSVHGSSNDLAVGEQVTVTGSANSDGSITAQSVQIRPELKTN